VKSSVYRSFAKILCLTTPAARLYQLAMALLISFAASAEASCQNGPAPNVDWTGCSKLMLLLDGANLAGGLFTKALLTGTDFSRATLIAGRFDEAEISRARLQGADLSGSRISKVVGWRVKFSNADLMNVDFSGADVSRSIFVRALIRGANFTKAEMNRSDFSDADLSGSDMSRAELARVTFTNAKLSGMNFSYSNLARADLREKVLRGVDPTGAYLFKTQLHHADLSDAESLIQQQLNLACGTAETKLPPGTVLPQAWPCPITTGDLAP
jgi:uncharacterized protein YjbI with pentapeptide repeats